MNYYYLKDNRIWMANEKMPQGYIDCEVDQFNWKQSLQPCEISDSELEKIISELNNARIIYPRKNELIEVTDIIDYYITCDCKCDFKTDECKGNEVIKYKFKQPSDNNGVITFKEKKCLCLKCSPIIFPDFRFNVCSICGNKRCPHASDHNYKCTNSNEPNQLGSVYCEDPKQVEEIDLELIIRRENGNDLDMAQRIVKEVQKYYPKQVDGEIEDVELRYTTQEMIDAVNYGFKYAHESQNHTGDVPLGNILQWIMYKRNLLDVPNEFKDLKNN